jgi:hypothetical protein
MLLNSYEDQAKGYQPQVDCDARRLNLLHKPYGMQLLTKTRIDPAPVASPSIDGRINGFAIES